MKIEKHRKHKMLPRDYVLILSVFINILVVCGAISLVYLVKMYQTKAMEQYDVIFLELNKILSTTSIVDVKIILVRLDELVMKKFQPSEKTDKILSLIKNNLLNFVFHHDENKLKVQESVKKIIKIIQYIISNVLEKIVNKDGAGLESTINLLVSIHSDYFLYMKLFGRPTGGDFNPQLLDNIRAAYDTYIEGLEVTTESHVINLEKFKEIYENKFGKIECRE